LSRKLRAVEVKLKRATSGRRVSFEVKTSTAPARAGRGIARCGVAEIDITPIEPHLALAGYSLDAKIANGPRNPLFARALYLDDGAGNTAALCFLDLWCASRYLLHKTASYTSTGTSKIDAAHLILAGTHTHAGPGHYFGNTLYDAIVTPDFGAF
jgi:neutral ceramidase